ncbi:hypothetical protein [Massilia sp. erpn]|uniref:hypothetical protein n=1 Tax=Massilia sp. erpn TaxID=2738142 RepID=UPI00210447AB|nr:hypothetical protein [Massilia sp. erpn]UTY57076.1 hypothetical protein HPQ68_07645 [Massilia sp. erpn]
MTLPQTSLVRQAVRCESAQDYRRVASLRPLPGQPPVFVPYLVEQGETPTPVVALIEQQYAAIRFSDFHPAAAPIRPQPADGAVTSPPTASVVLSLSAATLDCASCLAMATGRSHHTAASPADIEMVAAGLGPHGSLLVMGELGEFTPVLIRLLSLLSLQHSIGVLCAHSYAGLTQVVAWRILQQAAAPKGRHFLMLPDMVLADAFRDDNTTSLYSAAFTPPSADEEYDFIGVGGHGNSIHVDLGSRHTLCGKRQNGRQNRDYALSNGCQSAALCIIAPGRQLLPLDQLRARLFLVQTCMGIALGDPFHSPDLSLPIGAIECGALGYLSSTKVVKSRAIYAAMVSSALRSGYSMGECASLLGRLHVDACREPASHLLFGDPEVRLTAPQAGSWQLEWHPDLAGRAVELTLTADSQHRLYRCELPRQQWGQVAPQAFRLAHVSALTADGMPAPAPFIEIYPTDTSLVLLCVSAQAAGGMRYRIRISWDDQPAQDMAALARRIGLNLVGLRAVAAYLDQQNKHGPLEGRQAFAAALQRLSSGGDALQPALSALCYDLRPCNTLALENYQLAESETELILDRMDQLARAEISQAGGWRHNDYFTSMFEPTYTTESEQQSALRCGGCAAQTDFSIRRSVFYPDALRHTWHCQRCQQVLDRPAEGMDIRLETSKAVCAGDKLLLKIHAHNPLRLRARACGIVRVHNKEQGPLLVSEEIAPLYIDLQPQQNSSIELTLCIDHQAMIGHHRISLLYISEFGLACANSSLHVAPRESKAARPVMIARPRRPT